MEVTHLTIIGLVSKSVGKVVRKSSQHPTIGSFFDTGTYAYVRGIQEHEDAFIQMTGETLYNIAAKAGIPIFRTDALTREQNPGKCIQIVQSSVSLDNAHELISSLHEKATNDSALSLVITDKSGKPPLVIISGYNLPCMGQIEYCKLEDVWCTWFNLFGYDSLPGRNLLQEPYSPLDSHTEVHIIKRLKQLYGE